VHAANGRGNHGAAGVLEAFPGIEAWLLAYHALAVDFLNVAVGSWAGISPSLRIVMV
jgi:hypothetical protein